ncbi:RNA-guided endonuclease InsQ/TnpB family protein [Aliterella atlantica]|uniref:Transposase n=1 Tax=Aliterella atlantica CENA595 TaxID=1618023 RepID=A0A0D8ZWR2_9CYAN|nr:RNA-guided endonuclease TnpB family protein [Aliterella atlantica]KJH73185.1 transposase [Aliterella atlantica CENA595]
MSITVNYEYKLKPSQQQMQTFEAWLLTCKKVYNYALGERKDWVNSRRCAVNACSLTSEYILPPDLARPTYYSQCKSLTSAKKNFVELTEPHIHVLQQTLRQLEAAFVSMWERGHGFPRFKKKMRSFVYPDVKQNAVEVGRVKLPKIGWVRMRMSRPLPEGFILKQMRVARRVTGYFVMLTYQLGVQVPDVPAHGHFLGVDIGLDKYLATSDGELVSRPRFFNALQGKLKLLQRRLKHKKKGSSNWLKLTGKIARIHQKINDTRKDWHFKLAHQLCDSVGAIFVEDINFIAWAKGLFGKHTLDAAYGQFFNILSYVCWKRDVFFLKVDKNYTSQICPNCQTHTGKKDLRQRTHYCSNCGYTTNRDVAAAQVILQRGILAVGQPVSQIASGDVLLGVSSNTNLGKCP